MNKFQSGKITLGKPTPNNKFQPISHKEHNPNKQSIAPESITSKEENSWRLSKYLAVFGGVSRREAEKEIMNGTVFVNNLKPKNAAVVIKKGDIVTFKHRRILPSSKVLQEIEESICVAIYKPIEFITSRKDEKQRKTVYHLLPQEMQNFHYVGRLDYNSEGVLLFTNNPKLARGLEDPSNQIVRTYHVKVHGMIDEKKLHRMQKGVIIEGESYLPKSIKILPRTKEGASNTWLEFTLTQGKNKEIRKLCEHFNLKVAKLIRFSFANISIKDFNKETIYKLSSRDVKKLKTLANISGTN